MNNADFFWLIGLLEGEGSFMAGPPSSPNNCSIAIEMTDRDILARVSELLGVKIQFHPARRINWKSTYTLRICGNNAAVLMRRMYPYMGSRRKKQIIHALMNVAPSHYLQRKLSPIQVNEIRKSTESLTILSKRFNIDRKAIWKIRKNETYRDVVFVV